MFVSLHWINWFLQGKVQELQRQLNHELDNHQKTREELHKCKNDLQNMKQKVSKSSIDWYV